MEVIETTTKKEFSRTESRKADDKKVLRRKQTNKHTKKKIKEKKTSTGISDCI